MVYQQSTKAKNLSDLSIFLTNLKDYEVFNNNRFEICFENYHFFNNEIIHLFKIRYYNRKNLLLFLKNLFISPNASKSFKKRFLLKVIYELPYIVYKLYKKKIYLKSDILKIDNLNEFSKSYFYDIFDSNDNQIYHKLLKEKIKFGVFKNSIQYFIKF